MIALSFSNSLLSHFPSSHTSLPTFLVFFAHFCLFHLFSSLFFCSYPLSPSSSAPPPHPTPHPPSTPTGIRLTTTHIETTPLLLMYTADAAFTSSIPTTLPTTMSLHTSSPSPSLDLVRGTFVNDFYRDLIDANDGNDSSHSNESNDGNDSGVYSSSTLAKRPKSAIQRIPESTPSPPSPVSSEKQEEQRQPHRRNFSLANTPMLPGTQVPTWPSGTIARFHLGADQKNQEHRQQTARQPAMVYQHDLYSNPTPAGAVAKILSPPTQTPITTPPRISSLPPKQQHSPPPSPPRISSIVPVHPSELQSNNINAYGYGYGSLGQHLAFVLEPSPTPSTIETKKSTPASSPASSISIAQPTHVELALAALSANSPRPSTSTISSSTSITGSRPRPSSYAPTKISDVSSTLANMSTLATLPIPPASSSASSSPVSTDSPTSQEGRVAKIQTIQQKQEQEQGQKRKREQEQEQQQEQQVQEQAQEQVQKQESQPQSATPTESGAKRSPVSIGRPSISILPIGTTTGVTGAGGGYQMSPKSGSPRPFGSPVRASTMDYRKTHSGSQLVGDSTGSSSKHDAESQAESPVRSRRKQIHRRNTHSVDLASASFHRSDDDMEMDDLEARKRMDALKKSSSRRMSKRKNDNDDRVLIGTRIGEDHVNYVLMYNMLTGIRVSVSAFSFAIPASNGLFDLG